MKDSYTSPDQDSTPPLLPGSGQITQKGVNRLISERVASSPAGTRHKAVEARNVDGIVQRRPGGKRVSPWRVVA